MKIQFQRSTLISQREREEKRKKSVVLGLLQSRCEAIDTRTLSRDLGLEQHSLPHKLLTQSDAGSEILLEL